MWIKFVFGRFHIAFDMEIPSQWSARKYLYGYTSVRWPQIQFIIALCLVKLIITENIISTWKCLSKGENLMKKKETEK